MRISRGAARFGAYIPALLLLALSTLGVAWLDFQPKGHGARTLVMFSPAMDGGEALRAVVQAGGSVVARAPLPFSLVARSDDPAFYARLRKAGAWLLLDATGKGGCYPFSVIADGSPP